MSAKGKTAGALVLVSASLLAFLSVWEGEEQFIVYPDDLAGGLPTVCRGLTKHITDTPIVIGEVWSAEKCLAEEERAIAKVQGKLINCFTAEPPQSVFDAASSHAWNFGLLSTCGSEAMAAWRIGEWDLGCRRLYQSDAGKPVWSYVKTGRLVNGKPEYRFVKGLANRRYAEFHMCISDVYNNGGR